ncbi:MAG: bifunctional deaminase-reductase domain protein [Gemmatimonadetes bacterium]|nr:bifunctional deaminase-reductase domain protein [Gemmatimonadota bacterium]
MSRLLVLGYTISLDGYGAGPRQSLETPLGAGGEGLHDWLVNTPTFKGTHSSNTHSHEDADADVDEEFAARSMTGVGAWIMGRNMFGPQRGPWTDGSWRGWWGEDPPYHAPTFVLTHHARASLEMEGGTVFHFVTDGIDAALERAREVAGEKEIRLLGGADVIRQYLKARLIDELHIAVTPILLGSGEHLFAGIDLVALGYKCTDSVASDKATHYTITRI